MILRYRDTVKSAQAYSKLMKNIVEKRNITNLYNIFKAGGVGFRIKEDVCLMMVISCGDQHALKDIEKALKENVFFNCKQEWFSVGCGLNLRSSNP